MGSLVDMYVVDFTVRQVSKNQVKVHINKMMMKKRKITNLFILMLYK